MATFSSSSYTGNPIELQTELLPEESLLWSGQPLRRAIFHRQDFFAIPFSLAWGGFAIFWEFGASGLVGHSSRSGAADPSFALWGIPFVVMGQYMIWGRFFYTAWKKTRTYYGVTNKRVIVLNTVPNRKITDAYFRNIDSVSLSIGVNGVGTIEFAPEPDNRSVWKRMGSNRNNQIDIDLSRLIFFDIADARSVHQLIQTRRGRSLSVTNH
jgi:hypothetical protein